MKVIQQPEETERSIAMRNVQVGKLLRKQRNDSEKKDENNE